MRPILFIAMLLLGFFGSFAPALAQVDDQPCGEPWWHNEQQMLVQDCELWTDPVPVVAGFQGPGSQQVVGELVSATGNWFTCQVEGSAASVPGTDYTNTWWAATMADNGEWGFVNEAYFAGGENNQPDARLAHCDGGDVGGQEPAEEYEWSDCIWGDAPREYVVATFTEKDGTAYTLTCGGVVHIRDGHGFNERTIPCIARVLAEYDSREPSNTDSRNDLFRLQAEIPHAVGNYIDAHVVIERTHRFVVTAFVEPYAIGDLPAYEGDAWAACSPVSEVA